ncbi:MAG: SpoIIE family protein phosphatase [Actinomycetota bacterium]|nr:SpoIIE family protein phosphatase [Actinomycetota bacterium]
MPGDRFIELAMSEDKHVLDVMFKHASDAVTVQDTNGRLVYANDRAARLIGFESAEEMLRTPVTDMLNRFDMIDRDGNPFPLDALPGRRVIAGEPVTEEIVGYQRRGDHSIRWSRVSASPIKNDAREIVLVINFFSDITDEIRQEENRLVLSAANELLGASLEVGENVKALAKLIVPNLASWFGVHLLGDHGNLTPMEVVHPDTEDANYLVKIRERELVSLDSDEMEARVVRTMTPEIIPVITPEMLQIAESTRGAAFVDLIRRLEFRSVVCVPLRMGNQGIGALTAARSGSEPPFDRNDVDLLLSIAERAAISLDNARLYEHEREVSIMLQKGLAPRFLPAIEGIELAARYQPLSRIGHLGGDFYDVIEVSPKHWSMVVGDIEGKGVSAAAAVGLARHTVRATVTVDSTPMTVVGALNRALLEEEQQRMCTLAYCVLEQSVDGHVLRVSLAGHPPPLIVSSSGEITTVGRPCPPAGVISELLPIVEEVNLSPGDTVIMYTDGVALPGLAPPESMEKMLAGETELALGLMLDMILDKVQDAHQARVPDDVALLGFRVST